MPKKLESLFSEYVGDGVYLSFDGRHLILISGENKIYLEERTLGNINLVCEAFFRRSAIKYGGFYALFRRGNRDPE